MHRTPIQKTPPPDQSGPGHAAGPESVQRDLDGEEITVWAPVPEGRTAVVRLPCLPEILDEVREP